MEKEISDDIIMLDEMSGLRGREITSQLPNSFDNVPNATLNTFSPTSVLQHQQSLPPFPTSTTYSWGGVGGFMTPPQPAPPLSAPPMTVSSTLGNPLMPTTIMHNGFSTAGFNFRLSSSTAPCKRKPDDDMLDKCPIAKQHISEERVSAGLNSLHLSTHYTCHSLGSSSNQVTSTEESSFVSVDEVDTDSDDSEPGEQRLFISPELTNIPVENSSALPDCLLKSIRREGPCLEVVLWQPRPQPLSKAEQERVSFTTPTAEPDPQRDASSGNNSALSSPDSGVSVSGDFPMSCDLEEMRVDNRIPAVVVPFDCNASETPSVRPKLSDAMPGPSTSQDNYFPVPYAPPPQENDLIPSTVPLSCFPTQSRIFSRVNLLNAFEPMFSNNNNNNNNAVPSAYTDSWLEENNNTGLRDFNTRPLESDLRLPPSFAGTDLPPLPDDDDMDL